MFKSKKPQSQLVLEASKQFIDAQNAEEEIPQVKKDENSDIMDKLKHINPSEVDPRIGVNTTNSDLPANTPEDITSQSLEGLPQNTQSYDATHHSSNDFYAIQHHNQGFIRENIPQVIDEQLHGKKQPQIEDVIYELRTIKSQNDLIIDLLRQIQRKLNM